MLPACVSPADVAAAERTLVDHAGAVDAGIVVKLGQRIADYLNPDGLIQRRGPRPARAACTWARKAPTGCHG